MIDLTKVSHLDARQAVKAHFDFEETSPHNAELKQLSKNISAVEEKHRAAAKVEAAPLEARRAELLELESQASGARHDAFVAALEAQGIVITNFQLHADYCGVYCCALSDLPLMWDDRIGTTPDGNAFLWCLIAERQ